MSQAHVQGTTLSKRSNIQCGDLLVWSNDEYSLKSDLYLNLIRFATRSEFAHTAVAWRLGGHLMAVEATQPVVRLNPVREWDSFYHIPMNINWSVESEEFLLHRVGCVYSFMDAYRAYVGRTVENDDRYQCAELCKEFYELHGTNLGTILTPSAIVKQALQLKNTALVYCEALTVKPNLHLL